VQADGRYGAILRSVLLYSESQKGTLFLPITLANVEWLFSPKFRYLWTQHWWRNEFIDKDSTTP